MVADNPLSKPACSFVIMILTSELLLTGSIMVGKDTVMPGAINMTARPASTELMPPPFAWVEIPAGKVTLEAGGYVPAGGKTFDVSSACFVSRKSEMPSHNSTFCRASGRIGLF